MNEKMTDDELVKKKRQAEAFFQKRWKGQDQHVSDFGAYCVEQWLSGRNPGTSYEYLGIDYLRSFAHRYGTRGSSDMLSRPPGLRVYSETGGLPQLGANSVELRRFEESSLLRDRRLSQRHRIHLILYYEWQFDLKELGDVLGVSESRASQVLTEAVSAQKALIQAGDSSFEERSRQRREQKAVSREIQERFSLDEKTERLLEKIRAQADSPMVRRSEKEIPEALCEPFAVYSF
jgi:hypothetical protein